ncbi:MAG: threonine/serine dehydratase [Candidatus Aminicenantes bacterium]|nr:threonine/serine dehydratase [Candidatus Aminicenantes bacterium]
MTCEDLSSDFPARFLEARRRLAKVARVTPLVQSKLDPGLHFKAENLQVTGSFKIRAAYNQMVQLDREQRDRGIVTSSSGNFAQAVAYAARMLDLSAKIVMMESSSPLKVAGTRRWGGEVVFCESRFEARDRTVRQIREEENRSTVHPYDHPAAVSGNGTAGLEILAQLDQVENVVVPISGGGLISGIAVAVKERKPGVKVWGIQPRGSNATYLSFRKKEPVALDQADTVADGLTVTRPGSLTFPLILRYVDEVEIVEEDSILYSVGHLMGEEKLVVEPSGAVPLAAVLEGKVPLRNTVLVLSGGNMGQEIMNRSLGLFSEGRSPK